MNIFTKILATTLPLVFLILFTTMGTTYYFSRNALTGLAEAWLETRLSEAIQIASEQEKILHKYGLEGIPASEAKAKLDTAASVASIDVGAQGYIFAVDKRGIITMHPDTTLVGSSVSREDWFQSMETGKGRLTYSAGGIRHLAMHDYFPPWEWFVLATDPEQEVYGVADRMKPYLIGLVVSGILILSVALMFMTRRFTAPLRLLAQGADRIGQGDLETRISIPSRDELGRLAQVFNQMTVKLQTTLTTLQTREEHFRSLIENATDIITLLDADGTIQYESPSIERILGYAREEMSGKKIVDWVHPEDREAFLEFFSGQLNRMDSATGIEVRFQHHDGSWRTLETTASNLLNYPAVNGVVMNSRDISKRKLAEAALKKSHQELEKRVAERTVELSQANRQLRSEIEKSEQISREKNRLQIQLLKAQKMEAIGTLAGGIAHDFNNILMGIQGHVSILRTRKVSNDSTNKRLNVIQDHIQSAASLTKQLLGFARLGKYETRHIDLNALIIKSSEMFGQTKKELRIKRTLQEKIWTVKADPGQMEQVLLNLFINAWQSMPNGGELLLTTQNVTLDEPTAGGYQLCAGTYVKLCVEDTGEGMDKEIQEKIFDPFFTTKQKKRGTGLGLASVYGIIRNHGGFIKVDSIKGEKTTFTIFLPGDRQQGCSIENPTRDLPLLTGTETLLLVDDEPMILDACRELLEIIGYKVLTAGSGKQALEVFQENQAQISLVILDMIMPDMGGSQTFDRLKMIRPDLKVLLASGYSLRGQANEIMERGCSGFIQKPFDLESLSVEIRRLLDN